MPSMERNEQAIGGQLPVYLDTVSTRLEREVAADARSEPKAGAMMAVSPAPKKASGSRASSSSR